MKAIQGGADVLIKASLSEDGTYVMLLDGCGLPSHLVDIVTDVPQIGQGAEEPVAALFFFATEQDRAAMMRDFKNWPGIEPRII